MSESACCHDNICYHATVYISLPFTEKDKLFWEESVGHIKISHKPAKARYAQVRIAVIIKQFCRSQMQVNAFMT